jgi:CsoR family transcriptional regulator, copper-sensing transcriptional repressor
MVEEDAYCVHILTQLSAVKAAGEKVGLRVIEDHFRGCVAGALNSPDEGGGEEKISELTRALETCLQVGQSAVSSGKPA